MNQLSMFIENGVKAQQAVDDICAARHGGHARSREANPTSCKKHHDREMIYSLAARRGDQGLTLDEASELMGVPPNSISGRFTELHHKWGLLADSGRKRKTRAGKSATVYRAIPKGGVTG